MSTHYTAMVAVEEGASEDDFYERRCSVCGGKGREGARGQANGRVCYLEFSCESCEGTGQQLVWKPGRRAAFLMRKAGQA